MYRVALVTRTVTWIRDSDSPAVWAAIAAACRVARRIGPHRSRWASRLGYALERLDVARDTRRPATASVGPSGDRDRRVTGRSVARQLRAARRHSRHHDWGAAAAAYRALLDRDGRQHSWWYHLGRCLWRKGDLLAAAEALAQATRLGGASDPRPGLALADLYERAGFWADAQAVLLDTAKHHPDHATTQRRLGEVSLTLAKWGGTFSGALAYPAAAGFRFHGAAGDALAVARAALERAAALEPARTSWRPALAEARLADGDLRGAAALYEAALRHAADSTGRWVFAVTQQWQFQLESIYHRLGRPRVADPLFDCVLHSRAPGHPTAPVPGVFDARTTFGGLTVEGMVAGDTGGRVEILVDGRPLRSLRTSRTGGPSHFQLEIKRAALDHFPTETTIEVRLPDRTPLLTVTGAHRLHLSVPHGDDTLRDRLAAGCTLDKKGNLGPTPREITVRHDRYLELYARARDFFEKELGRDLFLLYGTLLGYHRNGDLIPGDDDFDVGYVCHRTDPVAVKEETKGVILRLVRAGFTVSFNRKGRLFRLHWRDADDLHLDVRPVWFQDGRVWLHNHCSFPACVDDFLPVEEGKLRGVAVRVPRDTEKFLLAHYGPTWRVPDQGFTYHPDEVDPAVARHLAEALISAKEYRDLADRVHRERQRSPGAGRLVSIGSRSLYPLERFIP